MSTIISTDPAIDQLAQIAVKTAKELIEKAGGQVL